MLSFFKTQEKTILAVQSTASISATDTEKLCWLFGNAEMLKSKKIDGNFVGPRREMITPWSTNAVEITQIMGINGITRIEEFISTKNANAGIDKMLQYVYEGLNQYTLSVTKKPDPIIYIENISEYNKEEGLALNNEEIEYLNKISKQYGRKLTDSEVFGFSQVNSEHCRHKIFNGIFIIDGKEKKSSLFKLIKKTSKQNPNYLVSAYKDNVAFNTGPEIEQFAPKSGDKPDFFQIKKIQSVISLKAETHNFPTTVEPFNGAATGTGGEIRDRLGGGKASLPIAGTAVYMTSYPRNKHEKPLLNERKWLYQKPEDILIKASNGASDFGNKFGQPLICGSLLTFEHRENNKTYGYDKVIMLAGGVGFAKKSDALKEVPKPGEKIIVLGGDNYRIGMGGGAVSSVDTGKYKSGIELNAVQRANPEMQKRTANVIRALAESDNNPIVSIHDHGAGGHLNCLSELVENTGGEILVNNLPIGDPTLSAKEIIGNESQERMGLLVPQNSVEKIQRIAERERSPMYVVGKTTNNMHLTFKQNDGKNPIDMDLEDFFGKTPKTYMHDNTITEKYEDVKTNKNYIGKYVEKVLQLEAVACKDWLTNKVDRSVTGKIARQQCQGELQLPLSDLGAVALDYRGEKGIATSIGHAPQASMINAAYGSTLAIAEALTNIVFAPLKNDIKSISLSANWMWPCKNKGEDARLYKAVEACSKFACKLGINVPTGKDSLSMTQKYPDGENVLSPGTVIISAAGEVENVKQIVSPVIKNDEKSEIYYIDFSFDKHKLGGSALAQSLNKIGTECPTVKDPNYFVNAFNTIQELIKKDLILAGHDISAGGMITTLLEMCFANQNGGLNVDLKEIKEKNIVKILFAENPGIILQLKNTKTAEKIIEKNGIGICKIATITNERYISINKSDDKNFKKISLDIDKLRDLWYKTSYILDTKQSGKELAKERFNNYKNQPLEFLFPQNFNGKLSQFNISHNRKPSGIKAAIIREKGTNGEREMAYSLYLAGFDVKDVHMTDLVTGRETLEDISMVVFCGGFANSDVLGSAKGWAGAFKYNKKAKIALEKFYNRKNTLSLGICNGCQLMIELNLINPEHKQSTKILHNNSRKLESNYITVAIPENNSVMFKTLSGSKLGIWIAHGEGKFSLPMNKKDYNIVAKYNYNEYPANPNGSDYAVAGICSANGRHLAMMPHLERSVFPWQCAHYPQQRKNDEVTPWIEAFVNARKWIEKNK